MLNSGPDDRFIDYDIFLGPHLRLLPLLRSPVTGDSEGSRCTIRHSLPPFVSWNYSELFTNCFT